MEVALNGSKTEELILQEFEEMNTSGDFNEKLTYSQTVSSRVVNCLDTL